MKHCIRNHYFVAFFSTLVLSAGLLITSFFLPPKGAIDPTALQGAALMFCWPALAFAAKALDDNKRVKLTTKVGTITVGKTDDDTTEELEETIDQIEGEDDND